MNRYTRSTAGLWAMLCCIPVTLCQTPVAPMTAAPAGMTVANLPAHKLGQEDLIGVTVYDAPELTRTVRVAQDGTIRLPMLKQPIPAAGKMPSELEAAIAHALEGEEILVSPVVTVTVVEYQSRPISVAGAVKSPTTFQANGSVTLLEAITRAGGLAPNAGVEVLVSRAEPGSEKRLTQRVAVKALIDQADAAANMPLRGGEEIRVPEVGRVFLIGNIKKPGGYPVRDGSETTLLKMLAEAEGLTPFASKVAFIIRQVEPGTPKQEIPVELSKILKRKTGDVPLNANDIVYVPDDSGRRISVTALEKIVSFGSATASGVLVWGR